MYHQLILLAGIALLLIAGGSLHADEIDGYHYVGTINHTLSIQASLHFTNDDVSGKYRYDSQVSELNLIGKLNNNHTIAMDEYSGGNYYLIGTKTGMFTWVISTDHQSITGTWHNVDRKRRFPFMLTAMAEYRKMSNQVVCPGSDKSDPDSVYYIKEIFPVFLHPTPLLAKLNQSNQKYAMKDFVVAIHDAKHPVEGNYSSAGNQISITYVGSNFISFSILRLAGSGHSFVSYITKNYLLTGKTPHPITLDELFVTDSHTRKVLLQHIRKQASALAESEDFDEKITLSNIPFTLTPAGVTFIYPREAGNFGGYFVAIPFAKMKDMLNPQSQLSAVA